MITAVTVSTRTMSMACLTSGAKGYEFALSLVMFKCHAGLTDEDRKAVADWREKHWKDTK